MEKELSESLRKGEAFAYQRLFEKHYTFLVLFANKYVHDIDVAKDVVQEVFVHLYLKKETLQINHNIKAYLYKAVYNHILNHLKKIKRLENHYATLYEETDYTYDFQDNIEITEKEHQLYNVIENLPEQRKRVFKMSRFDGKKNKEIAEELNLSIRTVETHLSNALSILKKAIISVVLIILCSYLGIIFL